MEKLIIDHLPDCLIGVNVALNIIKEWDGQPIPFPDTLEKTTI
jgi:hypothetical protein